MSTRLHSLQANPPHLQRLYIFGAGGSGREIAWLAREVWGSALELFFVVDREEFLGDAVNGIPVILIAQAQAVDAVGYVGAVGDCVLRRRIVESFAARAIPSVTIVHPRAEVSPWTEVREGAIICAGTVVTTNVRIERHVHVNIGCTVSHDVRIGEFTTLSPGVHISGHVHIGRDVFIGTGADIINGTAAKPLLVGDGATIAAGACVLEDVHAGTMVAGVPAQRKR